MSNFPSSFFFVSIILICLFILIALLSIAIHHKKSFPKNTLMQEIQQDIILQMAHESDIRKSGKWKENKGKSLVLLRADSIQVMTAERAKKFKLRKHLSASPPPDLVALQDYQNQDLHWALVYGNNKTGRRYDLRPKTGGDPTAIIEIYDYNPWAGFAAMFASNVYYVHDEQVFETEHGLSIASLERTPAAIYMQCPSGSSYRYQRGDGIVLTETPEELKPDQIFSPAGDLVLEMRYDYLIRICTAQMPQDMQALLLLLFTLHQKRAI